jgi:hypothetical protein
VFLKATAESLRSVLDENCPSKNFADEQLSLLVGLLTKRSSMQQRQIYQRKEINRWLQKSLFFASVMALQ